MVISVAWQTPCRPASLQKLRKCVLGEGLTGYIPETSEGCTHLNRFSHWAISSLQAGRVFFGWDKHFCPSPDLQAQSKNTWVIFSPFTESCDLQEIYSCCTEVGAKMTMAYWEIPFHWESADFSGDGQSWSRALKRAQSTAMPTSLFRFYFFFLSPFPRKPRNWFSEFPMSTWWQYRKEYREFLVFAISRKLFASWMINICHVREGFSRLAFNLPSKCSPLPDSLLSPAPCGCLNDKYGVWKFTCCKVIVSKWQVSANRDIVRQNKPSKWKSKARNLGENLSAYELDLP